MNHNPSDTPEDPQFDARDIQLEPETGDLIGGKYRLQGLLQETGLGRVFLAERQSDGEQVVVKMVHEEAMDHQGHFHRFQREAKAMAQFAHPNIVGIMDYDLTANPPYLVMEYIEGETLRALIDRHPNGVPLPLFFEISHQLCDAVDLIHRHGIIHRDLKPTNMMVRPLLESYQLKVLDFGLILFERAVRPQGDFDLTQKGTLIGSPAYMSPEQCLGGEVRFLTDIYNLGLISYELLTGSHPFQGRSLEALLRQHLEALPKTVMQVRPGIPMHIGRAVQRALSKKADNRFFTAKAFLQAMRPETPP